MTLMSRNQPELHEAMRMILVEQPDQAATLQTLSDENVRRDLYRMSKGDGPHPPPNQFRLRARRYPNEFDVRAQTGRSTSANLSVVVRLRLVNPVNVQKPFLVDQLRSALVAIRPKISDPQMSMLRAHYLYRTLSMERIAKFGGYGDYHDGNLQYGALCGRIARQLGFMSPGCQTFTIAESTERDEEGDAQWRMDDAAVKAIERAGWFSQVSDEAPGPTQPGQVPETEREALIKARVGQGSFRTDLIALWGGCAVTGCSLSNILVASHLVPWKACATDQERLDPFNGLLLTPNLDKLVDRCLIAFDDDGSVLLSKHLTDAEWATLGVNERSKLRFVRPAMLPYLRRHRELFRGGSRPGENAT
jgi:hypothetical protein